MAMSKCPCCGKSRFEGVNKRVINLPYEVTFIQCADCGCVVGVLNTQVLGDHIVNGVDTLATIIKNK